MADDLTKRGPEDRKRISLTEEWEVRRWCDRFDCSEGELRAAVAEAGHMARDVEAQLAKARGD